MYLHVQPDPKTIRTASKTRQSNETGGALGVSREASGERAPGVSPRVEDALGVTREAGVKSTGVDETLLDAPDAEAAPVSGAPVGASKNSSASAAAAASASFLARLAARVKRFTLCSIARICGTLAEAGDASRAVRAAAEPQQGATP